jgi:small subunit ribosomal protein S3
MKRELLSEEVDQIINQSFWQKGGFKLNENSEVSQQQEEETDEPQKIEEAHCPLCKHALNEQISDEAIAEHLDTILAIVNEMEDITDEDIDSIQEAIDEELGEETDEDAEEDSDEDSEDDQDQDQG